MSIIDRLLDLFGLQRKGASIPAEQVQIVATTQQPQEDQQQQKQESALDASFRRQREVSERIVAATTDFASTAFELKAMAIEQLTKMLRDGGTYDEKEFNRLVEVAFTNYGVDVPVELSDEIKQALRDALHKRGREDDPEKNDDQGEEPLQEGEGK